MGCEEAASRRLILEKFKLKVANLGELPEISWQSLAPVLFFFLKKKKPIDQTWADLDNTAD